VSCVLDSSEKEEKNSATGYKPSGSDVR